MKNVCMDCKSAKVKDDAPYYCVKYGCFIWQPRIYCVAYERSKNETDHNNVIAVRDYLPNKHG